VLCPESFVATKFSACFARAGRFCHAYVVCFWWQAVGGRLLPKSFLR
jgi:hypothetical protein